MIRDIVIAVLIALAALAWLAERADRPEPAATETGASDLLSAAPEAFERVTGPQPLDFPRDHGVHPGYRNEWWYFTGNLISADGRRFGYQFTLFRFGVEPGDRPDSDFAADAVWMAHLAVSDVDGERFITSERFARGALGLAGAEPDRWWLRDWRVEGDNAIWRLQARTDKVELDLELEPARPVVLQGEDGYSRKGPAAGNASRYYSITRIETRGRIAIDGQLSPVTGLSWLDREWGSSQLGEGIAGWDWFALQLDDGRDLMVYRLRAEDGRASRFSAGALVAADGSYRVLGPDDFALEPQRTWRDTTGTEWPVAWRGRLPGEGLEFEVRPAFEAQRWYASVAYWEGAVEVFDPDSGARIGRGYLELSGYADGGAGPGVGPGQGG